MQNFREFEAGPDPFGRKYKVQFKWLQTAISIRHSDTVDVKFILTDDAGQTQQKTIALPHADLLALSKETGRPLDDPWCARIAMAHLQYLVSTGEDMEKDLVTVPLAVMRPYAQQILSNERTEVGAR